MVEAEDDYQLLGDIATKKKSFIQLSKSSMDETDQVLPSELAADILDMEELLNQKITPEPSSKQMRQCVYEDLGVRLQGDNKQQDEEFVDLELCSRKRLSSPNFIIKVLQQENTEDKLEFDSVHVKEKMEQCLVSVQPVRPSLDELSGELKGLYAVSGTPLYAHYSDELLTLDEKKRIRGLLDGLDYIEDADKEVFYDCMGVLVTLKNLKQNIAAKFGKTFVEIPEKQCPVLKIGKSCPVQPSEIIVTEDTNNALNETPGTISVKSGDIVEDIVLGNVSNETGMTNLKEQEHEITGSSSNAVVNCAPTLSPSVEQTHISSTDSSCSNVIRQPSAPNTLMQSRKRGRACSNTDEPPCKRQTLQALEKKTTSRSPTTTQAS